uniref:Kinesin motor domain-containing protein n=1 Tax=Meloidogyne javanica TaxID=6303 RepID=A0A915LSS3_MELJA
MANPSECCIQVVCRVRPLNEIERKNGSSSVVKFQGKDTVMVTVGKTYAFDNVFQPNDTQENVYKGAAHHIVQDGQKRDIEEIVEGGRYKTDRVGQ